jgi:hypothetical protein
LVSETTFDRLDFGIAVYSTLQKFFQIFWHLLQCWWLAVSHAPIVAREVTYQPPSQTGFVRGKQGIR